MLFPHDGQPLWQISTQLTMEWLWTVVDWIVYLPTLPMVFGAMAIGVYMGLGNASRKKLLQEEMAAEEKKLLEGYGAKNTQEFKDMVADSQSVDRLAGATAKYRWTQTAHELEMFVRVSPTTSRKDGIKCTFTSTTMELNVGGEVPVSISGTFCERVSPSDCNWQLDGDGEERVLWVIIQKAKHTMTKHHWKSVLVGDLELEPDLPTTSSSNPNLPPVINVDSSSSQSMVASMQALRGYKDKMGVPPSPLQED